MGNILNTSTTNPAGLSLHHAVASGNLNSLIALVDSGADLESRDHTGTTARCKIVLYPGLECFEHLIKHGADVNAVNSQGGRKKGLRLFFPLGS